jgi:hypothetical protein
MTEIHRLNSPAELAAALGENVGAPIDLAEWHMNRWEAVCVGWEVKYCERTWVVCNIGGRSVEDMTFDLRREEDGEMRRQYAFHINHISRVECRKRPFRMDERYW